MKPFTPDIYVDLIGKPYAPMGRGPEAYDCYGLCLEVLRRRDIIVPELASCLKLNTVDQEKFGDYVALWEPCPMEPGAILCFRDDHLVRHVGIALDEHRFLHSAMRYRQVVIDRFQGEWVAKHLDTLRFRRPVSQD
jgi:cell wall-associated NlpC family hydrolase